MLTETNMAQHYEGRRERRSSNGALSSHASHVREDMAALQKDFSKLRSDIGTLAAMQWRTMGDRVNSGVSYVGEQVRTRPMASIGLAAGAGLLAGIALVAMNGRAQNRRH